MAIQSNAGGAMTGREPERDEFKSKLAMTAARQPLNIRPTGKGRQKEAARYFETVLRLNPQLAPAKQCSIKILMFRQKLV